jgi:ABC-type uncharacterized transport system ATPase subunit
MSTNTRHASGLAHASPKLIDLHDTGAPPDVRIRGMTKRFGAFTALDDVSMHIAPGAFHALLGENGAGKSTLVKCLMGYYRADGGEITIDNAAVRITDPAVAHRLGLGMVYQHFTLVPSMTVAENLVLGEPDLPHIVNWSTSYATLSRLMDKLPFTLELDRPVSSLAAGEKQKLEIVKQLHLGARVLVLDEPTSVLTPDEADEILGLMRAMVDAGQISVVLITHKLREVEAFAREVTVLRHGKLTGHGQTSELGRSDMVEMMIGKSAVSEPAERGAAPGQDIALQINGLTVDNDKGVRAIDDANLKVVRGEILGIAGVSGNGQKELVEVLAGQRQPLDGEVIVEGELYHRTREEMREHGVFLLPEEPLANGCVRGMSVAENMAIRSFDQDERGHKRLFIDRGAMRDAAMRLITAFSVKTRGPEARIETLSGGNIQRTVLARELSGDVKVLIAQNPCFGLDLNATAEIRNRIMAARNDGAAVLLISEDLDEIMELADRILVMFEGRIVYETPRKGADIHDIGRHMASHA